MAMQKIRMPGHMCRPWLCEIWGRKGCLALSQSRWKSRLDLFPFISILRPFQVKVGMLITYTPPNEGMMLSLNVLSGV